MLYVVEVISRIADVAVQAFLKAFIRPGGELFVLVLAPQAAILVAVRYAQRRTGAVVWPRLFPRSALTRRSNGIDISLSIFEYGAPLVAGLLLFAPVARAVRRVLPEPAIGADVFDSNQVLATAFATLATLAAVDFGSFLSHWLLHRVPVLWAFHAVHHSAPEMTPFTATRVHPVETVLNRVFSTAFAGVVLGVWTAMVQPVLSVQTILGTHAAFLLFQFSFAAVRHSSIPISFGPLEHIFVSPRMHQLHHSNNPAHNDRNFGTMLSIWDAMFGRRLRTFPPDGVRFGVAGVNGDSFHETILSPFTVAAKSAGALVSSGRPRSFSKPSTDGLCTGQQVVTSATAESLAVYELVSASPGDDRR